MESFSSIPWKTSHQKQGKHLIKKHEKLLIRSMDSFSSKAWKASSAFRFLLEVWKAFYQRHAKLAIRGMDSFSSEAWKAFLQMLGNLLFKEAWEPFLQKLGKYLLKNFGSFSSEFSEVLD